MALGWCWPLPTRGIWKRVGSRHEKPRPSGREPRDCPARFSGDRFRHALSMGIGGLRWREIAMALNRSAPTGLDFSRVCTLLFVASGVLISTSGSAPAVKFPGHLNICYDALNYCFRNSCNNLPSGARLDCYLGCVQAKDNCMCNLNAPGQVSCAGACTNPQTDYSNCGQCGNACSNAQVCSQGVCTCPWALCGGTLCCAPGPYSCCKTATGWTCNCTP
jgi:hypothetical protein